MEVEEEKAAEPCLTYTTHHAHFNAKQCKRRGTRMTARALLHACERTLSGFLTEAPQNVSSDDYAASVLPAMNVVHPYDIVFVEQVLYGCCRYTMLLSVLVSKLLKCKRGTARPSDGSLYTVLGYLILIRLEELKFSNLCLLMLSHNAQRLLPFVEFIFSVDYLNNECKPEWMKIYDIEFVEELINNIAGWSEEAADLERRLAERVFIKDLRDGRKTTPKPFKLSVCPRPKPQPKEETPPALFKAKPARKFKSPPTPVQKTMVLVSMENKKRQAEFYADPHYQPFHLRTLERPTNIDQVREEVENRFNLENEYIPAKVSKCPEPSAKEVKLTAAAVLREHALYQKQVDADRRRVQAFESELRDEASFKAWQEEERARYKLAQSLELKFRREAVVAVAQAIQEAKHTVAREKHEIADDVRGENQVLTAQREEAQLNIDLLNKLKREEAIQERAAVKEAVNKYSERKKTKAMELMEQKRVYEAELEFSHSAELKIKQELVRQLRAVEMEFVREVKKFDPDTTNDHGLLVEMSVSELRQKLERMKVAFERERQARQNNIIAVQKQRRNNLVEKALFVRKMREVTKIEQVSKRELKKRNRPSTATTIAALATLTS